MGVTHYDGTYEEEIKHHSAYAIPKASLKQEELTQALRQKEVDARRIINPILAKISDDVFAINKPIILASKEKPQTWGGWEKAVGAPTLLDFDSTEIDVIDTEGKHMRVENGKTYLVIRHNNDGQGIELQEIEIPRVWAMIPKTTIYQKNIMTPEQLHEMIAKYNLSAN